MDCMAETIYNKTQMRIPMGMQGLMGSSLGAFIKQTYQLFAASLLAKVQALMLELEWPVPLLLGIGDLLF